MEIITNPTQELLDSHLLEWVKMTQEYKNVYRGLKQLEYKRSKLIDGYCNIKDEKGKKLYTYKNQAESAVDEEFRGDAEKLLELNISRKDLETDLELYKTVYYHARNRIFDYKQVDATVSIAGSIDLPY